MEHGTRMTVDFEALEQRAQRHLQKHHMMPRQQGKSMLLGLHAHQMVLDELSGVRAVVGNASCAPRRKPWQRGYIPEPHKWTAPYLVPDERS